MIQNILQSVRQHLGQITRSTLFITIPKLAKEQPKRNSKFFALLIAMFLLSGTMAIAQSLTQSTPGTYSFTVPAGVTSITVSAWGGGGAGGGNVSANSYRTGGG